VSQNPPFIYYLTTIAQNPITTRGCTAINDVRSCPQIIVFYRFFGGGLGDWD
jgi:hypothetical protein